MGLTHHPSQKYKTHFRRVREGRLRLRRGQPGALQQQHAAPFRPVQSHRSRLAALRTGRSAGDPRRRRRFVEAITERGRQVQDLSQTLQPPRFCAGREREVSAVRQFVARDAQVQVKNEELNKTHLF